jgi:hypothetical protein
MARSFGDAAAESVGVYAEPELTEVQLGSSDKFLIWASDGVWEFITSQEAVDIVSQFVDHSPQEVMSMLRRGMVATDRCAKCFVCVCVCTRRHVKRWSKNPQSMLPALVPLYFHASHHGFVLCGAGAGERKRMLSMTQRASSRFCHTDVKTKLGNKASMHKYVSWTLTRGGIRCSRASRGNRRHTCPSARL